MTDLHRWIGLALVALSAMGGAACLEDFDQFDPVGGDVGDTGGPNGDGSITPTGDGSTTVGPDTGTVIRDSGPGPDTAPCVVSAACLDDASGCTANCKQVGGACTDACAGNPGCTSKCDRDLSACKAGCLTACESCTQATGCPSTTACANATQ